MRYVVTEIEGYRINLTGDAQTGGAAMPGIACHVLDTAFNNRLVAQFDSEDCGGSMNRERRRELTRERAATRCDLLNRLDEIAREAQGAVA